MGGMGAGVFIVASLVGVLVALVVGAAILRLACSICGVQDLSFGRAMYVVFIGWLAGAAIQVALGFAASSMAGAGGGRTSMLLSLAGVPVQFLVIAAVYSALIPTSYLKGLLIYLVQFLIVIAIAAVVFGVLFAVGSFAP